MTPLALAAADERHPARVRVRLGEGNAPAHVTALGNLDVLDLPKTALLLLREQPSGHLDELRQLVAHAGASHLG